MVAEKKIVKELSEKLAQSGLYMSKEARIDELAKDLKINLRRVSKDDLRKVRKILSRGEPLSKIVVETRGE